jgi:hypothetical protein
MNAEALYRFFALPARAAHESWLVFIPSELITAARRSTLGTRVLSRLLERRAELSAPERFELAAEHAWIFEEPLTLLAAARRLGAAALGAEIATCVERDKVRKLRAALGDELHREAIASPASLVEPLKIEGEEWSAPEKLRSFIERTGIALMLATLPADEPLRRRVALKFPEQHGRCAVPALAVDDTHAIATRLGTILKGE